MLMKRPDRKTESPNVRNIRFINYLRALNYLTLNIMGKGDIKTRKGKLANGSFGIRRMRNETMPKKDLTALAETAGKPKKAASPKAKAKKA